MYNAIFLQIILAIIFGAAIGLERESSHKGLDSPGGMRTYSIVGLLGALAGLFFLNNYSTLGLLIGVGVLALLVAYYVVGAITTKDLGLTSELSIVSTFIIGSILTLNILPLQIVVAIFVFLMLILSLKTQTHKLVAGISFEEIQSFISYAIIALVILPFLPDISYRLNDIPVLPQILQGLNIDVGRFANIDLINLRRVWMIVVLITGIDVIGYILGRIVGNKKSFTLTSFVAGFISSTSTTQSLAQKSNKTSLVNHLVAAAVLANLASFLQVFLLVGPLNGKWLVALIPSIVIMVITATILTIVFLRKKEVVKEEVETDNKDKKIFSLLPALKFAGLLIIIKIITKVCLIFFGQSGFIISSVIASFAGLDAIIVTLAEMAGTAISIKFALLVFLLVNATNLISKTIYSFLQGSRKFSWRFLVSALIIIASSFVGLLFIK